MRIFFIVISSILLNSCTAIPHTYYITRHAEKEQGNLKDPQLTGKGQERARQLGELLKNKNIREIFSTNTARTKLTAEPLGKLLKIPTSLYGPIPDSVFINRLKKLKHSVLIVGHSNTVDDMINLLAGEDKLKTDLRDDEYDNLFMITYRKKKITFTQVKY